MGVEIRGEEERDKERERERPSQKRHSPPRAADLVKLLQNEGSRYGFWNLEKSGFLQRGGGGGSRHKEAIFVSQRERQRKETKPKAPLAAQGRKLQ